MALAEDSMQAPSTGRRLLNWGGVLLLAVLTVLAALWLKNWVSQDIKPNRQVARITVLPDTPPPPPPPPPKEEQKPPPRDDQPPPPQVAPQPVQAPPAEAPIKMEGAAGSGDSPFQAGAVSNDYRGGAPVVGGQGGGVPNVADRAQHRLYAQATRQQLQAELERKLRGEATELVVDFSLWLQPDGSIERWDLRPSGNAQADSDMRTALDGATPGLRFAPPPAGLVQPMRFRLSVRPAG